MCGPQYNSCNRRPAPPKCGGTKVKVSPDLRRENRVHPINSFCSGASRGQLQAKSEGDLSERARRRADEIADDADLRTRAPKGFSTGVSPAGTSRSLDRSRAQRDWRLPAVGTLLTRRLDGRDIIVKVLEDGFEYQSRRYRSLSAIAREVTGTRWNGLLFFGLSERRNG
jgi:hypothetical protein